jgi:hypothetical protein
MTLPRLKEILDQAVAVDTVEWIYFEGGEPFLYYPLLLSGVRDAARRGFKVGVVSNAYWATSVADALEWIGPLAGLVQDLTISSDWYHRDPAQVEHVAMAGAAAQQLQIPVSVIRVAHGAVGGPTDLGDLSVATVPVRFQGRASEALAGEMTQRPWAEFRACDREELRAPQRVHVDYQGNVHVCQGISIGNVVTTSLEEICRTYDPDAHPIVGPLLEGGPVELVLRHGLSHEPVYADACHLCYSARTALRERYPEILTPDQMYGVTPEPDLLRDIYLQGGDEA